MKEPQTLLLDNILMEELGILPADLEELADKESNYYRFAGTVWRVKCGRLPNSYILVEVQFPEDLSS